ncbi:hypothetical protein RJ640_000844 [Escallonia rubra]|uniref:Uncharacterized protein n=1 Tax=Escallonia rubra TaxID=112253 RepID=A0AA88U6L0_9ASTE|nr:hypothetical protein RJ640_000844 [Escallonia rubra]
MRKFDPWPVFFRREWNRNWPFLVGFAVTGAIITKLSLGFSEEDAKNSPFVQRHKRYFSQFCPNFTTSGAMTKRIGCCIKFAIGSHGDEIILASVSNLSFLDVADVLLSPR